MLAKEIDENNDRSETEVWDSWSDHNDYHQVNKLFQTGGYRREYGDCELGPKCPRKRKFEKKIDEE